MLAPESAVFFSFVSRPGRYVVTTQECDVDTSGVSLATNAGSDRNRTSMRG